MKRPVILYQSFRESGSTSVPCKLNNAKTNKKHLGQLMDCLSVSEKTANENS